MAELQFLLLRHIIMSQFAEVSNYNYFGHNTFPVALKPPKHAIWKGRGFCFRQRILNNRLIFPQVNGAQTGLAGARCAGSSLTLQEK